MEDKKNTLGYLNESGEEVKCKINFTFDSAETGKSYVIFSDDKVGEDGRLLAYAASYDPSGKLDELFPIENEKEWDIIYSAYESIPKVTKVEEKDDK